MISGTAPNDRLLRIEEVAELTGLAVGTVYHLVSQKRIPVVRISSRCIRFRLSSLESWFAELTQEADTGMGRI
jgi:excisionase family DNA binding protein